MPYALILIIAVSLSMDAFSLSLAYGTLNLPKRQIVSLAIIVGIYHFIMPLLGLGFGNSVLKLFTLNVDFIVFVVLSFIGVEMIFDTFKKKEDIKIMNFLELLAFGLAVSIDSFSVGIGLKAITSSYILSSLIFSLSSFTFTYLGLRIGGKAHELLGQLATLIGGLVLLVIGIIYLF